MRKTFKILMILAIIINLISASIYLIDPTFEEIIKPWMLFIVISVLCILILIQEIELGRLRKQLNLFMKWNVEFFKPLIRKD